MMCCPADDGAAVRDPRPRGPRARAAARSPGGAAAGVGAADRSRTPAVTPSSGPVVGPSTMTRTPRSSATRPRRSGPTTSTSRSATTRSSTRSSSTTSCSGSREPGDGDKLVADGETGPGGRIPFNTDGGLTRPRSPRRPDRPGDHPRVRAAAAGRRHRPSGRGCARRGSRTSWAAAASAPSTSSASPTEGTPPCHRRRPPRGRESGAGPAVARHAERPDRAVPGGEAGARLLRLRAADRVRHDLVPARSAHA